MMHVGHDENTRYYLEQDGKKWELHTANEEKHLGGLDIAYSNSQPLRSED